MPFQLDPCFPKAIILILIIYLITLLSEKPMTYFRTRARIVSLEKTINTMREASSKLEVSGFYKKRLETQHIDCGRVLRGDKAYIKSISGIYRIPLISDPNLDISCEGIRRRVVPKQMLRELQNPMAFARIVYEDYEFLEKQVQMSYHPLNTFCFALDSKASDNFKILIRNLGKCLSNVFVIDEEFPIDRAGHFMNLAHYSCMKRLIRTDNWRYMILMQNHDMIGKSVHEISRILELLGGANDVKVDFEIGRVPKQFKWDPKALKLFRNESKIPVKTLQKPLVHTKGSVQGSLSREAVKWMLDVANLDVFLEQWNQGVSLISPYHVVPLNPDTDTRKTSNPDQHLSETNYSPFYEIGYGVDEQWLSTFQSNAFLGMPGHFTDECLKAGYKSDYVSRFDIWQEVPNDSSVCGSGKLRHGLCILGIEDLPVIAKMPNLLFNKVIPSFDYSIVDCTAELLYNRTFLGQVDNPLEEDYYENMVHVSDKVVDYHQVFNQVLYHKHHLEPGYMLKCTPSYQTWDKRELKM